MKINELEPKNIIVNCDDFAISKGVDETVLQLCEIGALNSVSVFVVTERFEKSMAELKKVAGVKIGLHLSLTFGKALTIAGKSLITEENGNFNKSFGQILLLSVFKKKEMARLIEPEIAAQFEKLQGVVGGLHAGALHVDGHQHIHTIPLVFGFVKQLKVDRIRIINERFWQKNLFSLENFSGAVKLAVLRFLGFFNNEKIDNKKSDVYFVSMLKTCKMNMNFIKNCEIPKGFNKVEVMVHVGNSQIDAENTTKERPHLTSKWRDGEAEFVKEFRVEFLRRYV